MTYPSSVEDQKDYTKLVSEILDIKDQRAALGDLEKEIWSNLKERHGADKAVLTPVINKLYKERVGDQLPPFTEEAEERDYIHEKLKESL